MAHASPPDPICIVGVYDDGDQDDLITLAAWATGATGAGLDVRLTLSPVEGLPPRMTGRSPSALRLPSARALRPHRSPSLSST